MYIKTPFIAKINFTYSEEDISLIAKDIYGNRVDIWIEKTSGDEMITYGNYKVVYAIGKEYEQKERYEKDPNKMTRGQLLDDLINYTEEIIGHCMHCGAKMDGVENEG